MVSMVMAVFGRWPVRRVSTAREWSEETLHEVEELNQHLAAGEGREEVVFVAVDGCCPFVPKMVTVEKDVVGGVELAAVGTRGVVVSSRAEASGIVSLECMSCDKLEGSGLVGTGVSGENSADKVGEGKAGWFPEGGESAMGVSGRGCGPSVSPLFFQAA
jgi:hypothetical protein